MTAAMVADDQVPNGEPWDYLLEAWRELDVPEGWRAEIDGGQIVLVPPPHAHHNGIAAAVQRALYRNLPEELEVYQTLGIHIATLDKLYVPDLVVMPKDRIAAVDPEKNDPVDAAEALLVVEITSRNTGAASGAVRRDAGHRRLPGLSPRLARRPRARYGAGRPLGLRSPAAVSLRTSSLLPTSTAPARTASSYRCDGMS